MCPCNPAASQQTAHQKDTTCSISQCIAAVKSDDTDALDEAVRGPCACGYSWPTCTRPLHALALDAQAERLEKIERYVGAFSTALALVRLDPASAVVSTMAHPSTSLHRLTRCNRATAVPRGSSLTCSRTALRRIPPSLARSLPSLEEMAPRPPFAFDAC
jgi:hypothetical protein